jgi:hypothetical protein
MSFDFMASVLEKDVPAMFGPGARCRHYTMVLLDTLGGRLRVRERQEDREARAFAGHATQVDRATEALDHGLHDREAQAGAAPQAARREEGFERAREGRLVHAAAIVFDEQECVAARRQGAVRHVG